MRRRTRCSVTTAPDDGSRMLEKLSLQQALEGAQRQFGGSQQRRQTVPGCGAEHCEAPLASGNPNSGQEKGSSRCRAQLKQLTLCELPSSTHSFYTMYKTISLFCIRLTTTERVSLTYYYHINAAVVCNQLLVIVIICEYLFVLHCMLMHFILFQLTC